MNKLVKYFYLCFAVLFLVLTLYELYVYLRLDSSYVGMFYLFFSFFIMFLLFTVSYNYSSRNIVIRISKNVMVIVFGLFVSFLLSSVLGWFFSYSDSSKDYLESVFLVSKIIKPIMYLLLGGVSFYEFSLIKKSV